MENPLATEFPADNPLLGSGSAWVCSSLRGRALPTRRRLILVTPILLMPEGAVPPPHSLPAPVVAKAAPAPAVVAARAPEPPAEVAVAPAPPPDAAVAPDPFESFVAALGQALLAGGQTRAAAVLPGLLQAGSLREGELPSEAVDALRQRGVIEARGLALTSSFRERVEAWRRVLCGTSDDLSACGDATLDTWSSELLCALSAAPPARAGDYRRELRKRGVAAFGLIEIAA